MDSIRQRFLVIIASLFFLVTIDAANSQTQPSVEGYTCRTDNTFDSLAYGLDRVGAADTSCSIYAANRGLAYQSVINNGFGCRFTQNGSDRTESTICAPVAVCLTGDGYEAADASGFCPDPFDDDDGDGNPCDEGEEGTAECECEDGSESTPENSCPENDRDGDGIPDKDDGDDGVCDNDNPADGDCNGVCDVQDESGSEDCEEGECPEGELEIFQPFDLNEPPYTPPLQVCSNSLCKYVSEVGGVGCYSSASDPRIVACEYTSNGESCVICDEPSCTDQECPEGTSRSTESGNCEDIPDFCEIDEHTNGTMDFTPDGIPDNEGTFACEGLDEPCDPEVDECTDPEIIPPYSCGITEPPPCDTDPVICAIREESFREHCGTTVENQDDCETPLVCEGDTYECLHLQYEKDQRCLYHITEEQASDPDSLANFKEGIDDGDEYYGRDGGEGSFVDFDALSGTLDDSGFGWPRTCLADETITWQGDQYELNWSRFCEYLAILGYIVMLIAGYISFRILESIF